MLHAIPPRHTSQDHPARLRGVALTGLAMVWLAAGCTALPDPATPLTDADLDAPYPALVPAEGLLDSVPPDAITPQSETQLDDRVTALEQRAASLRATALEADTRARMDAGVDTE